MTAPNAFKIVSLCLTFLASACAVDGSVSRRSDISADQGLHPGKVVLVERGGDELCRRESGWASLELPTAFNRRSVLRIASLTKQFTAAGVLKLVERGDLFLDDHLGAILPDMPPAWRGITIRQLLSHTSGLTNDMSPVFRQASRDFTPAQLVSSFKDTPLLAKPGEIWRYSNLNYWVLGLVIEKISNTSYTEFIDSQILKPAGLIEARYGDYRTIIARRARGYEIDDTGAIYNARYFSTSIGYSAGGYVASPEDMARWYEALGAGDIISQGLLKLALTPVKMNDGESTDYGLGWYIDKIGGVLVAHHGGSSVGFSSYIYWAPDRSTFVGVFRNWSDSRGEPSAEARAIMTGVLASGGRCPPIGPASPAAAR